MSKLPVLKSGEVVRILGKAGYYIDHTTGSHYIMRHPNRSGRITVPFHGNRDLKRETLHSIIKQSGLSVNEFLSLR
jgi:predicted RNA binding protein YcfA (HicA-like mRNA interferase family)